MAATYVTMAELRSNLGIGTLYLDATVEECCQSAEDQLNSFLWFDSAPVVGTSLSTNVASVVLASPGIFTVGQSVTIAGAGSTFNGAYTITGTIPWSTGTTVSLNTNYYYSMMYQYPNGLSVIQYAKVAADQNFRRVFPYGSALGADTKTAVYSSNASVREAAMILAVQIWQSRQVPNGGGMDLTMGPAPFQIGNSLMARIRSLIAPYLNPNAMVG
jgi:hypothetical protein